MKFRDKYKFEAKKKKWKMENSLKTKKLLTKYELCVDGDGPGPVGRNSGVGSARHFIFVEGEFERANLGINL